MNRVNQITPQIAVDAIGLESGESDKGNLVNFPSYDMEKKKNLRIRLVYWAEAKKEWFILE